MRCAYCYTDLWEHTGPWGAVWVDNTGGDTCSGDDNLTNENQLHTPIRQHTANGVEIHVGLRVFTNDLKLGTVVKLNDDGWHDVQVDGHAGLPSRFNGERLTTRNPFTLEIAK